MASAAARPTNAWKSSSRKTNRGPPGIAEPRLGESPVCLSSFNFPHPGAARVPVLDAAPLIEGVQVFPIPGRCLNAAGDFPLTFDRPKANQ